MKVSVMPMLYLSAIADIALFQLVSFSNAQTAFIACVPAFLLVGTICALLSKYGIPAENNKLFLPLVVWYLTVTLWQFHKILQEVIDNRCFQIVLPLLLLALVCTMPIYSVSELQLSSGILLWGGVLCVFILIAASGDAMHLFHLRVSDENTILKEVGRAFRIQALFLPEFFLASHSKFKEQRSCKSWGLVGAVLITQNLTLLYLELMFSDLISENKFPLYDAARQNGFMVMQRLEVVQVVMWVILIGFRLALLLWLWSASAGKKKVSAALVSGGIYVAGLFFSGALIWGQRLLYILAGAAAAVSLLGGDYACCTQKESN